MRFTKMQGLGNDYLYVFGDVPDNISKLSRRLSDRHFGAGSDGMIYISPSDKADFKMRIFNSDGSEAMMCGNGIRCVGKYLFDKKHTTKKELSIETLSGIKKLLLHTEEGKVKTVTVDMGMTDVSEKMDLPLSDMIVTGYRVSVGNPHFVIFSFDPDKAPVSSIGPRIEKHPEFPGGINVEFASVTAEGKLRMRVWERGSGITMACGTGACAAAAAAVKQGFFDHGTPVAVVLDGGELKITIADTEVAYMEGPAETVFEGEIDDYAS